MNIVAASAMRPEFVQMFDVAFSRRMCCSRVASVRTNPVAPLGVRRHADEPARHLPHALLGRRDDAAVRAAVAERHAERLQLGRHDVDARGCPAARAAPCATGSVTTATLSAPAALRRRDRRARILDDAEEVRVLDDDGRGALRRLGERASSTVPSGA